MKDFIHYNARSVEEAVDLLEEHKGKAKLNAGGTDLLGTLKDQIAPEYPEAVINIKSIRGLDYIREDSDGLRVGALTKLADIADSTIVKQKYKLIAEAAKSVASPQIRNMCTIGGNIAQDIRCFYYRYPDELGGTTLCLRKGGSICNALVGDNRYHSIFGSAPLSVYPCASACPAKTAIPSYLAKIKDGNFKEAARIFVDFNPMPAITGRVCPTFCEPQCNRDTHDEAVGIRCVERSLGNYMLDNAGSFYRPPKKESDKKIAVIGSGPSGLSAAYYLRRAGHKVTIYEKLTQAGGMLFYAIPGYRLPKDVVIRQVKALEGMGITFECGTDIGKDVTIEELLGQFDAILMAMGAWKEKANALKADGATISGLQFLRRVNEGERSVPGKKVAVVGGGDVAIDVARTLLRLGAKPVVLYRRTLKEMPALKHEVQRAKEEGVSFRFLTLPTKAMKADGKVSLACMKIKLGRADESGRRRPIPREGSGFTLLFDAVISAIGEEPDRAVLNSFVRRRTAKGFLFDENVYVAGDFANGPSTVIEAVVSGRKTAVAIDERFGGNGVNNVETASQQSGFICSGYEPSPRISLREGLGFEDIKQLTIEDQPDITAAEAEQEARRCYNCGCVAISPSDIGVVLVAADGKIITNKRSIDASSFFAPHATSSTVLDTDEMITEIQIPKIVEGAHQQYLKFTVRKPIDFAVVSVGTIIEERNGSCYDVRIALGAVAPAPFRAISGEQMLIGKSLDYETASAAAEAATEGVAPLSKNSYKVKIARALVKRAILGNIE